MTNKQVTYVLNLKQNISDSLNKANDSVKGFETKISGIGQKTQSVFGGMMKFNIVSNLASGALSLGKSFVSMASDIETSKVAFEVLLGSSEKAKAMLGDMKKFADKTPFEFKDLQAAGKTMLGFQIPADKIMSTLSHLGDVSMGDNEKLQSMTLAFSQMSATGKLMGQDLNQMINAGFNPLGEMARTSGKSVAYFKDQMSKGAISSEMVAKAFETATEKGGPFFGMMEKMSKTTAGRWSTLKDTFNSIGVSIANSLLPAINSIMSFISELFGKFDKIKEAIQPIFDMFENMGRNIFNQFNYIDISMDKVIEKLKDLVNWFKPFFNLFESLFKEIINGWSKLFSKLSFLLEPIKKFFNWLKPILLDIGKVYIQVFKKIFDMLLNVIDVIKTIYTLLEKLGVFSFLGDLFKGIWEVIKTIGEGLQLIYDNTIGPIVDAIKSAYEWFKKLIGVKDNYNKPMSDKERAEFEKTQNIVKFNMNKKKGEIEFSAPTAEQKTISTGTSNIKTKTPTSPNTVKSNSPNNINITIGSLIDEFTIETTNLNESSYKVKEIITKILVDAVNDVNLVR